MLVDLEEMKHRAWTDTDRPRGDEYQSYREYNTATCCFQNLHRNISLIYLQQIKDDIDTDSGVDSPLFGDYSILRRKHC